MNKSLILCAMLFCAVICFSGKNTFAQAISAGNLLIVEVQPNPASPNSDPTGEYFILCNRTSQTINLQGLTASDAAGSITLPNYALGSGACVAFVNNATTAYGVGGYNCTQPANSVTYSGFSLNNTGGDRLVIANSAANGGAAIDAVSYGSDATISSPPAIPAEGQSLIRSGYPGGTLADTNTGADFSAGTSNPCTIGTVAVTATAASVTVAGRVISASGRGIKNVLVSLIDESGESRTVATSAFGYFRFADVAAGRTYVISAFGKRYTFSEHSQVRQISEDTTDLIFIADN